MRMLTSILASLIALACADGAARAQDWSSNKVVRILVPFAPGGTTDIVARLLADELKKSLGPTFLVENKPGADGLVAIQELIRGGNDGLTLMIGNVTTNAIAPILAANKVSFNYERDVVPVMRLVDVPAFLVATTKDFPPKNVTELVDYAKRNPGRVNYGTTGPGSYPHFDMMLLAKRAGGLDLAAIPNKNGASGMINDLLTGSVQISFINAASTGANVRAGTLRALAVVNHARLPDFIDIATMQEQGFSGVGTVAWQGLFAPASTPREVLDRVQKATAQALQVPAVVHALRQQQFNIMPTNSLDETRDWYAGEMTHWRTVAREAKVDAGN